MLAIQGGGAQAAFAAGVWRVLGRWLRDNGYELVGVGGASAGSWNAALISQYLREADCGSSMLERFWHDVAVPSVPFLPPVSERFRSWNGFLTGFLLGNRSLFVPNVLGAHAGTMPALYDSRPMLWTLQRHIGECQWEPDAPALVVKVVDAQTGFPKAFDNREFPITPMHLKASASIPLLFPATSVSDRLYWDGDFARHSVLDDVIRAVQGDLELDTDLLGIVIEPFPNRSDVPATTLGMSFSLLGGLLSGKGEDDRRLQEARKRHSEFVERARELVGEDRSSALSRLVIGEYRRLVKDRPLDVSILRIARSAGPFDYISRDFDFSPERISSLIRQGAATAGEILRARAPERYAADAR